MVPSGIICHKGVMLLSMFEMVMGSCFAAKVMMIINEKPEARSRDGMRFFIFND